MISLLTYSSDSVSNKWERRSYPLAGCRVVQFQVFKVSCSLKREREDVFGGGEWRRGRTVGSKLCFLSSSWCTFRELKFKSVGALRSENLETGENPRWEKQ